MKGISIKASLVMLRSSQQRSLAAERVSVRARAMAQVDVVTLEFDVFHVGQQPCDDPPLHMRNE